MITFKKSLVAIGAIGFTSGAMGAATLAPTSAVGTPTPEAISTADHYDSPTFDLSFDANYGTGDTISLTLNIDVDEDFDFDTAAITATNCGAGNAMDIALAGYQASTKVATYAVGAVTGTTATCDVQFPAIRYDGATLAAADVATVAVTTERGFGTLESVAATEIVNVAANQFTVVTVGADETIDVNANRNAFVGAPADATDVITITTASAGGGATYDNADSETVLSGDFSWAKTVDNAGNVTYPAIAVGGTGSGAVITDTSITFAHAVGAATITFTPPIAADDLRTLPATTYSATTTITYADADAVDQTSSFTTDAGSWILNGASITALGVSNSTAVYPMIWIQNSGTSNGNISGSVNCAGVTITIPDLGTAAALSNTKVGEAIQAAVDADGRCPTSDTRYDATVTVNAPAADITMNASYKVTAADGATDRVMLETSDSLPAVSN